MKLLLDSTTVCVQSSRLWLVLPAAVHRLADATEADGVHYDEQALEALHGLAADHEVVLYIAAGQRDVASWLRDQGFAIGARGFHDLAADADIVILPEHRDIEHDGAVRVPALGLHAWRPSD